MNLTGSAAGKLLLFGEHAALQGYPAVGVALDRRVRVALTAAARRRFTFQGVQVDNDESAAFARWLDDTYAETLRGPYDVAITSDLPISRGLGSSAALCGAIARAVGVADLSTAWALAHRFEHFFHGTPSGVDTGLAIYERPLAFRFEGVARVPVARSVSLPAAYLVIGTSPRVSVARDLIAMVQATARRPRGRAVIEELGAISGTVAAARSLSVSELGAYADRAMALLTELDLATETLQTALDAGRAAGALGGKLSGAGGGGAFYLVCRGADEAARVCAAVRKHLPPDEVAFVHRLVRDGADDHVHVRMAPRIDVTRRQPVA